MTTDRHLLLVALVVVACGGGARPFPARAPLTADPDMTPFAPPPAPYVAPEVWDTVDNIVFEPLTRVLAVRAVKRARNATAVDEVASSSWFDNRVERLAATGGMQAWVNGPCEQDAPDPAGPWTVTSGKPNGANPGFMLKHASGRRFLFKLDGGHQPERAAAADVIGSRVYHAAGYHVPCNRVAYIDPQAISIKPGAMADDFVGDKVPFTRAMLDAALTRGIRRADGHVRGGLSELLPGKPLGPWVDFGTRPDDPNDIIPHEDRRELRGSYVFAALLSHYDAREQNALDMWIETGPGGEGYVRHHFIDFGDCLGSLSSWPRVSRRRGHVFELDWGAWFVDAVTLGFLDRRWRDPQLGPTGRTLGYFDVESFDPDHYRTAYPYGPFTRVTEADAAWAARILARMSPEALRAIVDEAHLTDRRVHDEVLRVILGRRDKLLRRFLGTLSPLTVPHIEVVDGAAWLCSADLRIEAGLERPEDRPFHAALAGQPLEVRSGRVPAERCARLPQVRGRYQTVELATVRERPLQVHLAVVGDVYQVVGIER